MDIEIDLERSEYVKYRLSLMKSLQIPTLSEARSTLGPNLAQILFDQCDTALKIDFGLTPPLKGAVDELWVSPSDLLIGKVALKPPLTSKHIQALTHQGILKIGEHVEKKFWNETKMHEENYFDTRKRYLTEQFEEFFRIETKNIEQRERNNFLAQSQKMLEEFNGILLEELNNLEEKLRKEQQIMLKDQKKSLHQSWEQKFKKEIDKTVQNMTEKFLEELDKQKVILTSNFRLELGKAQVQKNFEIRLEQCKAEEKLKDMRHNLECKNIANMMYVLCMERRKCCKEKQDIEEYYTKQIQKLNNIILDKDQKIKELTEERDQQIKEVNLRESCLLEIIRQFQKFINFALRAAPTQAEFLLSIEKMMVFELTNTILNSDIIKMKPCKDILPWKHQEIELKEPESTELIIEDNHNCLKEIHAVRPEGLDSEDYLPAFVYKDKLYVREDFRNMISQGIEITESNELWSKDVEILIDTLRKSVSTEVTPSTKVNTITINPLQVPTLCESSKSTGVTSIQFIIDEDKVPKRERKVSLLENVVHVPKCPEERRASIKSGGLISVQNINFSEIGINENKPTLIAAANSLELIIKRGSVRPLSGIEVEDPNPENVDVNLIIETSDSFKDRESIISSASSKKKREDSLCSKEVKSISDNSKPSSLKTSPRHSLKESLVLDAKDSIILTKASLLRKSTEFNVEPKDSIEVQLESKFDLKRNSSRLVTAKNSLELLRESKSRISSIGSSLCSKKDPIKIKPVGSLRNKNKCCEKCSQPKDVLDTMDNFFDEDKHPRKDSAEKSIKLSYLEVIKVQNTSRDTNVSINAIPTVFDAQSDTFNTELEDIYKQSNIKRKKKKVLQPQQNNDLKVQPKAKIVGDEKAEEHIQSRDEFTEHQIRSFIELIKDNPTLLRTFTACTR